MTQFRVSKALIRAGVSEPEQHIIYGMCTKRKTKKEIESLKRLCRDVAGDKADALYRFVTDPYINHVYICMNYGLSEYAVFALKQKFYCAYKEQNFK